MKACKSCKISKDEKEFYKNAQAKGGLFARCRDCMYVPRIGRQEDATNRAKARAEALIQDRQKYGIAPRGEPEETRFWRQVEKGPGCWLWKGTLSRGRAHFSLRSGCITQAARWVWIYAHGGELTSNDFICHKCNNPACVNPDHLYKGDAKTNADDVKRAKKEA